MWKRLSLSELTAFALACFLLAFPTAASGEMRLSLQSDAVINVPLGTADNPLKVSSGIMASHLIRHEVPVYRSNWVFAYLEKSNPGGYALALELGFGKALGKTIILIDERSPESETEAKRLAMLHVCADACFDSLDAGMAFLREKTQATIGS